jgi:hypothetical protein
MNKQFEDFENFNVTQLRKIAIYFNLHTKISNVSKLKKNALITELKKHIHIKDGKIYMTPLEEQKKDHPLISALYREPKSRNTLKSLESQKDRMSLLFSSYKGKIGRLERNIPYEKDEEEKKKMEDELKTLKKELNDLINKLVENKKKIMEIKKA